MAKVTVVSDKAIKPKALARQLLPEGAPEKQVLALRDKILDKNEGVTKGQAITGGSVVKIGKVETKLGLNLKKPVVLSDKSTTNKFVGPGEPTPEPAAMLFQPSGPSSDSGTVINPVKTAPIDTVEFIDETLSAELMLDLLFEDVGGQELLTIARNDTVNGQSVVYQPFKNLNILQEIYNPANLLKLQETSDKIFSNFTIDLKEKIPKVGNGTNGANYYLDLVSGNGIIEFVNLKSDEQVEIQIGTAGIIEDIGI